MNNRPGPILEDTNNEYWRNSREGRLSLQSCGACEIYLFPARVLCPNCWTDTNLQWQAAKGVGIVFAYSVVHRTPAREFNDSQPYVVAIIELSEGVRMVSNVVECDPASVYVGMPVEARFEHHGEYSLPVFVPTIDEKS